MVERSVFELLRNMKKIDGIIKGTKYYEMDPLDDIGEKIEEEYYDMEGVLSEGEIELAHEYFARDYQRSQSKASFYRKKAEVAHNLVEYDQCLKSAWQLTRRAKMSYFRSREICADFECAINGFSDSLLMEHLGKFRERLYIMIEFHERGVPSDFK